MNRARFDAFRARVDAGEPVELAALLAEPDPWLRRACLTYVVRADVLGDAELRDLALEVGGKLARFIEGNLILRRLQRAPDAEARRDAAAYGQAWLRKRMGE